MRGSRTILIAGGLAAAVIAASCAAEPADGGEEIVITCTVCADDPSSVFYQYRHDLATRFNEEFAGRYRIDIQPNIVGDEGNQTYSRLAMSDDLPDLFIPGRSFIAELDDAADLVDFGPLLDADPALRDSFYEGILDEGEGGILYIPEQRDVAGVFYNTALLEASGIMEPPSTWDQFEAMAEAVAADGGIPMAVDGQWVTLLWLSHLIGTQDGGAEYLSSGDVTSGGFTDEPLWVEAVETLRDMHTRGFVNEDAFTGDFQRANAPFVTGNAATILNGPWQIGVVEGDSAAAPGLLDQMANVPAPNDGLIVLAGDAGWVSDADDPETQEAVWEFIKFAYTFDEQVNRTVATGSFPPVMGEFSDDQRAQLSPLNVDLAEASATVKNSYPPVAALLPTAFQDAWRNHWPAYVQGAEDTETFLDTLSDSIES